MNTKKLLIISVISGILSALPFIFENLYFIIFFSISPALYCIITEKKSIFKTVFFYFFAFYFFSDIWFLSVIPNFLSEKILNLIASCLLLIIVTLILSSTASIPFLLLKNTKISNPFLLSSAIALIYIFVEWFHGIYPINFPWNRLCNIVVCNNDYIQSASLFGGLFISFTIILINTCFAYMFIYVKKNKISAVISIISAVFIFSTNITLGYVTKHHYDIHANNFSQVLVIQPNHVRKIKRTMTAEQLLESQLKLAQENITANIKLIIFPETSISNKFFNDNVYRNRLYSFVKDNNVSILFGTVSRHNNKKYNSCVVLSPDRTLSNVYSKRQLVPVGEYTPALFLDFIQLIKEPFDCCNENTVINSNIGKIGCNICFESVFPSLSRDNTNSSAELLAILTNDSWLGDYVPLNQHHSHSVLRAVENRKYTITCANTGVSSIITPNGEIISKSEKNTAQTISANVSTNNIKTFYSKCGDIIIIPSIIMIIFLFIEKIYFLKNKLLKKLA